MKTIMTTLLTLEEMVQTKIDNPPEPKTIRFQVHSRWRHAEFPMDMLRYDRCYPDSSLDGNLIHATFVHDSKDRLTTYIHLRGYQPPTKDRWDSFAWVVTEVEDR